METTEIARQHISQAAAGLELSDSDDRATFRTRLFDGMGMTKRSFIVEMARALDVTVPTNASRDKAVRSIANVAIAELSTRP